jgi:hypothetical protein
MEMNSTKSPDSWVGISTGYELDDGGVGVRQEFSFLHVVKTGSGVHPISYQMGVGAHSLGVNRKGREADYSPPASAEDKKMWIYTFTPPYVFMAKCLIS